MRFKVMFSVIFVFVFHFAGLAQKISVKEFKMIPNDLTARVHAPVSDQNGDICALIKVITNEKGFVWEGDMLGIVKTKNEIGEYWLYVPYGAKYLTVRHEKLGALRNYKYPVAIKKARVYKLHLTTAKAKAIVEEPGIKTQLKSKTTQNKKFTDLPPILSIDDITFSENILNAEEIAQLSITIKNVGPGDAKNAYLLLSGYLKGLSFPHKTIVPNIKANTGVQTVTVDIKGLANLPTSNAEINIEVVDPNFKVKIQGKKLIFPTKELAKPKLIIAKYALVENHSASPNNQVDINEMIDLKFAVQNVGQGGAENVKINVSNNQKGVLLLGIVNDGEITKKNPSYQELSVGKFKTVVYRYFVNSEFTDEELKFTIKVDERLEKFGLTQVQSFPINTKLKNSGYIRKVAVEDERTNSNVIIEDIPDFVVDVDTDIPENDINQTATYALIIGNEDYSSQQMGLTSEQNVDFAENDAQVFATYCKKTFAIPHKQIKLLLNATSAEINQALAWISNLADIENGQANLIFYYSGHGLPHEKTKEPYIIPVDVAGTNLDYAIKLSSIYKKLTENASKRVTVFIDACFSGGARNQGLVAMKGVKIKPKRTNVEGEVVVFSSSTGTESSAVYREKHHGYFTYFLLKRIKNTKGYLTYKELGDYIIQSVRKETGLSGKVQTPQINVSPKVKEIWHSWKLIQ